MPIYSFRLSIFGSLLDEVGRLELADRNAALAKAHQLANALLRFADSRVPWADGVLVIESNDGSEPIAVPISDVAAPHLLEEAAAQHPEEAERGH